MYSSWARSHRPGSLNSSRCAQQAPRSPTRRQQPWCSSCVLARHQARHFTGFFGGSSKARPKYRRAHEIRDLVQVTRPGDPYNLVLDNISVHIGSSFKNNKHLKNLRFTTEDLDALTREQADLVKTSIFQRLFEPFSDDFWWAGVFRYQSQGVEFFLRNVLHFATARENNVTSDLPISELESALRGSELVTGAAYFHLQSLHGSHPRILSDTFKQEAKSGTLALRSVLLNLLETFLPMFRRDQTDLGNSKSRGATVRDQVWDQRFQLDQSDIFRAAYFYCIGPPFHHKLGLMYNTVLAEAILAIKADLGAPSSNIGRDCYTVEEGFSGVLRSVTVLQFPQVSGESMPTDVIKDIGAHYLGADVVHVTADTISNLLEEQAPSGSHASEQPQSLFRYRVAKNSGRMVRPEHPLSRTSAPEENPMSQLGLAVNQVLSSLPGDMRIPAMPPLGSQVLDDTGQSKEPQKTVALEPGDLRELAIKMDAGLQLIFDLGRDLKGGNRRVLIHVHDAVAIGMDTQTGHHAYKFIRGFAEYMRSKGRRVAVVATCSSGRAPEAYHQHLERLKADGSHRVMVMQNVMPALCYGSQSDLQLLDRTNIFDENRRSIDHAIRQALSEELEIDWLPVNSFLSSFGMNDFPEMCRCILPPADVIRIAMATIGALRGMPTGPGQITAESPTAQQERAFMSVSLISRVNEFKHKYGRIQSGNKEDAKPKKTPNIVEQILTKISGNTPSAKFESMIIEPSKIRTTFDDIHVPKPTIDAIKLLTELSIKRPQDFSTGILAAERIRGLLLYGPPGTGKTLLAKAVAKESGAHMIEVSAASLINKWAGDSEKNIKALFDLAKQGRDKRLVIFLDEADSLLGSRDSTGSATWRASITNQFLREMDGLHENNAAFVMMATNRPHMLDEALLRRLPRKLLVELPLEAARAAILRIHLKDETLDEAVSVEELARRTPLYSGSDLKNVCVAAAMSAVKETIEAEAAAGGAAGPVAKRVLGARHFDDALAQISASVSEDMAGLKAIKDFDKKYGDAGAKRNRKSRVGFGDFGEMTDENVPLLRR